MICPNCGTPVRVVSDRHGILHYSPLGPRSAVACAACERDALSEENTYLRSALAMLRDGPAVWAPGAVSICARMALSGVTICDQSVTALPARDQSVPASETRDQSVTIDPERGS